MISIILITIVGLMVIIFFVYNAIRIKSPFYKLKQLEQKTENIYQKCILQAKRDIQERNHKYYEYQLQIIQKEKQIFSSLKEKNKYESVTSQLKLYQEWLNCLQRIYRPFSLNEPNQEFLFYRRNSHITPHF